MKSSSDTTSETMSEILSDDDSDIFYDEKSDEILDKTRVAVMSSFGLYWTNMLNAYTIKSVIVSKLITGGFGAIFLYIGYQGYRLLKS